MPEKQEYEKVSWSARSSTNSLCIVQIWHGNGKAKLLQLTPHEHCDYRWVYQNVACLLTTTLLHTQGHTHARPHGRQRIDAVYVCMYVACLPPSVSGSCYDNPPYLTSPFPPRPLCLRLAGIQQSITPVYMSSPNALKEVPVVAATL
jgi:hypothetical protein